MPLISYLHQKKKKKNLSTLTGLIFSPDMVPGSVRVTARLIRQTFFFFFVMMKVKEKFWMKSQRKLTVAKKSVMQSVISERNL